MPPRLARHLACYRWSAIGDALPSGTGRCRAGYPAGTIQRRPLPCLSGVARLLHLDPGWQKWRALRPVSSWLTAVSRPEPCSGRAVLVKTEANHILFLVALFPQFHRLPAMVPAHRATVRAFPVHQNREKSLQTRCSATTAVTVSFSRRLSLPSPLFIISLSERNPTWNHSRNFTASAQVPPAPHHGAGARRAPL